MKLPSGDELLMYKFLRYAGISRRRYMYYTLLRVEQGLRRLPKTPGTHSGVLAKHKLQDERLQAEKYLRGMRAPQIRVACADLIYVFRRRGFSCLKLLQGNGGYALLGAQRKGSNYILRLVLYTDATTCEVFTDTAYTLRERPAYALILHGRKATKLKRLPDMA